jgi:hypothetical protein
VGTAWYYKGVKEISLTGKHGIGKVALVDDEDYELVSRYRWYAKVTGPNIYAVASSRGGTRAANRPIRMHKLLTGWDETDHRNGNGLDNRRFNLRPATRSQNLMNRSSGRMDKTGFKGVRFEAGKWRAAIKANGVRKHIGYFSSPELAAHAYDVVALELHGEFARLNFPDDLLREVPRLSARQCARPDCGKDFQPIRSHARYCSRRCIEIMAYRRSRGAA